MKILVLGGTGFIGSELTRELVARGHDVTVLARTPGDDASDEFRTVSGDVTDYDSIEGAFQGQSAVVNLVALSPLYTPSGGNVMHNRIHCGGTENVAGAAQAHGVEKVVQLSALGADPDGSTAYIRAKGAAEEIIRDSPLDWVIVRPSVVFGECGEFVSFTKTLTAPYLTGLPGGGSTRFQPMWVGDLVPILADCVERDDHVGETYELGGPEVLSLADVTKAVYRAEGKSVRILPVPMLLAGIGLGFAGLIPGFPMGRDQYRSLAFDNTVSNNSLDEFGLNSRDLHTFGEYLVTSGEPAGANEPGVADGVQG